MADNLARTMQLADPRRGKDGNTILKGARDPLMTDGRVGDFWYRTDTHQGWGPKSPTSWGSPSIMRGPNGWYAITALVEDGARRVRKVIDWAGGDGTKPAINVYEGASGLTATIGDAVDVRGPAGPEMVIADLTPAAARITDDTIIGTAEEGGDNEGRTAVEVFNLGSVLFRLNMAHIQSSFIDWPIKRVVFPDGTQVDRVTNTSRLTYVGNGLPDSAWIRSQDRFLPSSDDAGDTDGIQGGYWVIASAFPVKEQFGGSEADRDAYIRSKVPYLRELVMSQNLFGSVDQVPFSVSKANRNYANINALGFKSGPGHGEYNSDLMDERAARLAAADAALYVQNNGDGGFLFKRRIDISGNLGPSSTGVMSLIGEHIFNGSLSDNGNFNTSTAIKADDNFEHDCIIFSPKHANIATFKNLLLLRSDTQTQEVIHGFDWETKETAGYGFSALIDHVRCHGLRGSAYRVGSNRGQGFAQDAWASDCGTDEHAAWFQGSQDMTIVLPGLANARGLAMYAGSADQLQIFGGGMYYSLEGMKLANDCKDVFVFGLSLDRIQRAALISIGYNGDDPTNKGRVFVAPRFVSTNLASLGWSDVVVDGDHSLSELHLVDPIHRGNGDGGDILPNYHYTYSNGGEAHVSNPNWGGVGVTCSVGFENIAGRTIIGGSKRHGVYETLVAKMMLQTYVRNSMRLGAAGIDDTRYFDLMNNGSKQLGIRWFAAPTDDASSKQRWFFGESASGNLIVQGFNDAGAYLNDWLQIDRLTGLITAPGGVRVANTTVAGAGSAIGIAGTTKWFTNAAGGACLGVSNGSAWVKVADGTTVITAA